MSFVDALFESVSSWTTTGFTLLNPETLSHTILFWRSLGQWLGGLGIVVLALNGLLKVGITLYTAEGRDERIQPNIINTTKTIWWVYCLYTIIGIIFLTILGMPIFDSVNHTMTAIATGGMSTRAASVGAFDSVPIYIALMALMILGNISFLSHYRLLTGKVKEFIKDIQNHMVFLVLAVATVVILPFNDILSSSFHVVSAMGTGFQISGLEAWSDFSLIILVIVMIIGGAAGSTAGGIKSIRVAVLCRSIINNVRKLLLPKRVFRQGVGGTIFKDEEVYEVYRYSMLYIILFVIASAILMFTGYSAVESMFSVASAQGNVGLSIVSDFNIISKITLMVVMIAGRLEIWSVLVLVGYIFAKRS
ncbi:MAG: TrkH family potassium uptake protein [Candidatus Aenigmarchaeota archaeon]|nr:TrkH family potassium uptake protein [Candidatus Aenigmarchaeota archaeon]